MRASAAALPRWVYLPAGVGVLFVVLPLAAMALQVDWSRFGSLVSSPASRTALLLSLRTATASTLLCLLLGVPLALVLARHRGRLELVPRRLPLAQPHRLRRREFAGGGWRGG
jgi:molybdate transport system permease protein